MSVKEVEDKNIILIPTLEPNRKLLTYVEELKAYGFKHIVIVNDGSSAQYDDIFNVLSDSGCIVLKHPENRGKGEALKTGINYISSYFPNVSSVITADSDGQHAASDVFNLAQEANKHPEKLVLGVRDFSKGKVPPKSLLGNRISSTIFAILYGKYLPDTQTGLRAWSKELLPFMANIKGSRFEYELQVLITSIRHGIKIHTVPIQVIYDNGNAGTHFNAIKDSLSVMKVMFFNFFQFMLSSMAGAVVDLSLAWLLLDLLEPVLGEKDFLRIAIATCTARVISIIVNYLINRNVVFKNEHSKKSLGRYLFLCVVIMILSSIGVYVLHSVLMINEKFAKLIWDAALFILSYQVQRRWVFNRGR